MVCTYSDECDDGASCVRGACEVCPACAQGERCLAGQCLGTSCAGQVCGAGKGCINDECVYEHCIGLACGFDEKCVKAGQCLPTKCGATVCRQGEVCFDGSCTPIACVGLLCPAGKECADGVCHDDSCQTLQCGIGAACIANACIDTRCVGVVCSPSFACAGGVCEPLGCSGSSCAAGEVCVNGDCANAACVGVVCPNGNCLDGICPNPGQCAAGAPPSVCGAAGSDCIQPCVNGARTACQRPSGQVDTLNDAQNCGQCGKACSSFAGAVASCRGGVCIRGTCLPNRFDLDGDPANGCEATCSSTGCTGTGGNPIPVSVNPLPESGAVFQSISSATSLAGFVQTSSAYSNFATLGEPTPLLIGGTLESSNATHRNTAGIPAMFRGAPP